MSNTETLNQELIQFIAESPTAFQAVDNFKRMLKKAGYQELPENTRWEICAGGNYYVSRNDSSILAFRVPEEECEGFQIIASHSDSPSFKVKPNAEMVVENHYTKLNVEKYGGMLCAPWYDRPLSIAGRTVVASENGVETRLVDLDEDLVLIPNVAIHMNREVNDGFKYNVQTDLLPLYGDETAKDTFRSRIARAAGVEEKELLGTDLFLYNRQRGCVWGANGEFVSAPRLDDLQCAFGSMKGLIESETGRHISVCAVFDNEEVGSGTKQGAASTLFETTLRRIYRALGRDEEDYEVALQNSFMISADNAHAVHPNHPEMADPTHRPHMNGGPVIKFNANQKYTTDAVSEAIFRRICEQAEVPCQVFTNRSDMAGGSTLGNIANDNVALNTVDIGLPQLAMHSPYETTGAKDTEYMVRVSREFYSTSIRMSGVGSYRLEK